MARGDGEAARPKTRQRFKAAIERGDGQHPSPPSVILFFFFITLEPRVE